MKVVRDKKAGGSAQAYIDHPDKMINLLNSHQEIRLLQVIRNPIDASRSYLKSHPHEVKSFEEACNNIVSRTFAGYDLCQKYKNRHYFFYYEDLLSNPQDVLMSICTWLNLSCDQAWLNEIATTVNNRSFSKEYTEEDINIANYYINKYSCSDLFERYNLTP